MHVHGRKVKKKEKKKNSGVLMNYFGSMCMGFLVYISFLYYFSYLLNFRTKFNFYKWWENVSFKSCLVIILYCISPLIDFIALILLLRSSNIVSRANFSLHLSTCQVLWPLKKTDFCVENDDCIDGWAGP